MPAKKPMPFPTAAPMKTPMMPAAPKKAAPKPAAKPFPAAKAAPPKAASLPPLPDPAAMDGMPMGGGMPFPPKGKGKK